jgi:hypothetical protein
VATWPDPDDLPEMSTAALVVAAAVAFDDDDVGDDATFPFRGEREVGMRPEVEGMPCSENVGEEDDAFDGVGEEVGTPGRTTRGGGDGGVARVEGEVEGEEVEVEVMGEEVEEVEVAASVWCCCQKLTKKETMPSLLRVPLILAVVVLRRVQSLRTSDSLLALARM